MVERKDLPYLVHSLTAERPAFVRHLRQMSGYLDRLLVITAALSQIKSPYPHAAGNPNRIFQSLIAMVAGLSVPFLCTEAHRLAEEAVASYLYQIHLYRWLESNDYGRFLDNDLSSLRRKAHWVMARNRRFPEWTSFCVSQSRAIRRLR